MTAPDSYFASVLSVLSRYDDCKHIITFASHDMRWQFHEWCVENAMGRWIIHGNTIQFELANDAIICKLVCGS